MHKIKAYDKHQKVNVEIQLWGDEFNEINLLDLYSKSEGTWWRTQIFFHSPDVDNYQPERWSDLFIFTFDKGYEEWYRACEDYLKIDRHFSETENNFIPPTNL